MGTQKNRLDETVLLSTQNICPKIWVRIYLQFYAVNFCLPKPMKYLCLKEGASLGDFSTVNVLTFQHFSLSLLNKMLIIRPGIHIMLVIIANS